MGRARTVGPLRKTQKPNEETNEQSRSRQPAESGRPTRSEAWTAARAEAGTGWPTARRQQAWPAAAEIVMTGEPQRAAAALILSVGLKAFSPRRFSGARGFRFFPEQTWSKLSQKFAANRNTLS
jgi:hypothetical protein